MWQPTYSFFKHLQHRRALSFLAMDIENLTSELASLLSKHFQIIPTHSQRQDQWYKRSYQSFVSEHGARKLLILVPNDSKEEWVPHVRRFASSFSRKLKVAGREATERKYNITGFKLFTDDVLDEAYTRPLSLAVTHSRPMSPDMMQMSWWTTKIQHPDDKTRRVCGIKALIACGQIVSLIRLASWPQLHPDQVSHMQDYQWSSLNDGWQTAIDKVIVIILCLGVTGAFPNDMVENDGYKYWAPVAFHSYNSPFKSYIEAFGGRIPPTKDERQQEMRQCIEALCTAQAWSLSSSSAPIDWEERIMDKFLYILGFEAWNRGREGAGYLGCDLNKTKTAKSFLRVGSSDKDAEFLPAGNTLGVIKKHMDPLRLREPKQLIESEPSEDEKRELDELAALESSEVGYGRKRSIKYMNKNKQ